MDAPSHSPPLVSGGIPLVKSSSGGPKLLLLLYYYLLPPLYHLKIVIVCKVEWCVRRRLISNRFSITPPHHTHCSTLGGSADIGGGSGG